MTGLRGRHPVQVHPGAHQPLGEPFGDFGVGSRIGSLRAPELKPRDYSRRRGSERLAGKPGPLRHTSNQVAQALFEKYPKLPALPLADATSALLVAGYAGVAGPPTAVGSRNQPSPTDAGSWKCLLDVARPAP